MTETTLETLAHRATTEDTCNWLSQQTGTPWTLADLLSHGLTPYVWLEYTEETAELFSEEVKAYPAPVVYIEDTKRLAAGSEDVLIRFTRDSDKIAIQLKEPGISMPLDAIRFFHRDIAKLVETLLAEQEGDFEEDQEPVAAPIEIKKGITKNEVLIAFDGLAKINLEAALKSAIGIFGDDGARVRKNSRAGKNTHLWNPVTLALGLHDVHGVPMRYLKKVFSTQPCLKEWREAWLESLALLGE